MDTDSSASKERTERKELKNVGQRVPPVSLQLETTNHAKHENAFEPADGR